ncbi:MAG: hypothetical protein PHT88_01345 [Candidatus Moranbacteria bacterium]|nr:hypothetical protein [Candidatus Moranbacteria bacterium]
MKNEKNRVFASLVIVVMVLGLAGQSFIGIAYGYGYGYGYGYHDTENDTNDDEDEDEDENESVDPVIPETPVVPEIPVIPETPAIPETPVTSEVSVVPAAPVVNVVPVAEQPAQAAALPVKRDAQKKKVDHTKTIKVSSKIVKRGDTLVQSGKYFAKNRSVALYFSKSDGGYYAPVIVRTNKQGTFSLNYKANKAPGSYSWYAVDLKTGGKSPKSSYRIVQ